VEAEVDNVDILVLLVQVALVEWGVFLNTYNQLF
jgi:hypothetical protein